MAASQVYAVEGQCFVIAASSDIDQAALDYFKVGSEVSPLIELGGASSMIFAPDGRRLAEFLPETQEGLVMAELDFSQITMAKAIADPVGHYSKPESTRLLLNKTSRRALVEVATEDDWVDSADDDNGMFLSEGRPWANSLV